MRSKALLFSNILSTMLVSIITFVLWIDWDYYFIEDLFDSFYWLFDCFFDFGDIVEWLECYLVYLPTVISIYILPLLGVILGWIAYEKQNSNLAFASAIMYTFTSNIILSTFSYEYDLEGWGGVVASIWLLFAFIGYYKQKQLEK